MNDLIAGAQVSGRIAYPRSRSLRRRRRPDRGAPPHRHGVPEAEPVPEVDLRQRRVRAAHHRPAQGSRRHRRAGAASRPRSGTRSRTSSRSRRSRSRAVSSSGSASRAASRCEPDVILMDEPCSALDPIATSRIEDLMADLKRDYTIVIVTHNMQQAARVSDMTAFMTDRGRRARSPHRAPRRVRRHRQDLHQPVRPAHRGLHHRSVRVSRRAWRAIVTVAARRRRSGRVGGRRVRRARLRRALAASCAGSVDAVDVPDDLSLDRRDRRAATREPTSGSLQAEAVQHWLLAALDEATDAIVVVDRIGREVVRNAPARRFDGARTVRCSPRMRSTSSCSDALDGSQLANASSSSTVRRARCCSCARSRCAATARSSARSRSPATSPRRGGSRACAATSSPT